MNEMQFVDYDALLKGLETVVNHYEKTAPTVAAFADDLYMRINDRKPVQLAEIAAIQWLFAEDGMLHPNYAANHIYHVMADLGMDITGHAGF